MQITAAVAREHGSPFTVEQLELDALRPNELRVRMVATGICHTDVLVRDGVYPTPLPAVLGHEGAGIVEAVGDSVVSVIPGDHVVLAAAYCGHCSVAVTARWRTARTLWLQTSLGVVSTAKRR